MPFQIGLLAIPDDFSQAYRLRRQIEFGLRSEYAKYCANPDNDRKALLIDMMKCIDHMPTNGAFPLQSLDQLSTSLGVLRENATPKESCDAFFKCLKVYPFQIRALVTRTLRAIDNAVLTWGSSNDRLPHSLMLTLLYLAWIYPLIRLIANSFSILKYVLGCEGTESEKALPWRMRAEDQLKRFWPDLLIDVFWVAIRAAGCFVFPMPTPPPLPVSLFGSRVGIEVAATVYAMQSYDALDADALKHLLLKDRMTTIGVWSSYFLGALCGLINRFAFGVGSVWIAATCIVQTVWELLLREPPMALSVIDVDASSDANDPAAVLVEMDEIASSSDERSVSQLSL